MKASTENERDAHRNLSRRAFVAAASGLLASSCASVGRGDISAPTGEKDLRMSSSANKERPNILIIHADQHRTDCLGAYGNRDIRTPNMDALAAAGVRYEKSFCPYPVCTPSRYSLLCGLYPHEHRGCTNHCTLAPEIDTFPRMLRDSGYRTAAVGKMHFTPTYLDVGFERMFLAEQDGPGRLDDDYHRDLRRLGLIDVNDLEDQRSEYREKAPKEYWDSFGALPSNLPRELHSTEWIAQKALSIVEEWGTSGNLLMVGFIKPHHPFDPPKELCDAYDPEKLSLLPGWTPTCLDHDIELNKGYFPHDKLTEPALRKAMAYYYATIQHIDEQVGRFVQLLKRKKIYDNTMIVYTSDHGEYLGFHHLLLKGNYMYDPLVRVPLIVKYPHNQDAGTVSNALVGNIDLAPTLLRQAGIQPGSRMHGLDLADHKLDRPFVFSEFGRGAQYMVRSQTHKLIVSRSDKRSFFYDLDTDPLEMNNRYNDPQCQREIQLLEDALKQWNPPETMPEPYIDEDAKTIEQPNVPNKHDTHREEMIAYFEKKMREWGR